MNNRLLVIILAKNNPVGTHSTANYLESLLKSGIDCDIKILIPHSSNLNSSTLQYLQYSINTPRITIQKIHNFTYKENTNNLSINKYDTFCLIDPNLILKPETITKELNYFNSKNIDSLFLSLDKTIGNNFDNINDNKKYYSIIIFNETTLQKFILNNLTFEDSLCVSNFENSDYKNIDGLYCSLETINRDCTNTTYEDGRFMFLYFIENSDILNSYIFINKSNKKAYNLNNNIVGVVDFIDQNTIEIIWSTQTANIIRHKYMQKQQNDSKLFCQI